jgi:hypothetical protein
MEAQTMRTRTLVALVACLAVVTTAASQTPTARPQPVRSIGNWRHHDPRQPRPKREPWSPSDVVAFLERHPHAILDVGASDGYPAGMRSAHVRGADVNQAQALAAERGVDVANRLCVGFRFDVQGRPAENLDDCHPQSGGGGCDWEGDMDGSFGEQETVVKAAGVATAGSESRLEDARASWLPGSWHHRLLVLRPRASNEERRRVVENGDRFLRIDRPWQVPPAAGDAYEIRGSFDPAWVIRVSRDAHRASVRRFWEEKRDVCEGGACKPPAEPLDPFDPSNRRSWPTWKNRKAIDALQTPTSVPALYGWVMDRGAMRHEGFEDPYFVFVAVLANVRNPAYRDWSVRSLMYKLQDYGVDPGEGACVLLAYKPGFHTWYDEATHGPSRKPCSLSGTHTWAGPAFVCDTTNALGGPFEPTPYGPGEYETAVNDYVREMIAKLGSRGYGNVRIVTQEHPAFQGGPWSILADDVRRHPKVWGEWAPPPLEPKLAEIASRPTPKPPKPDPPAAGGGPTAPPTSGKPPPTTGGTDPPPPPASDDSAPTEPGSPGPGPSEGPPASGAEPPPSGSAGSGPSTSSPRSSERGFTIGTPRGGRVERGSHGRGGDGVVEAPDR